MGGTVQARLKLGRNLWLWVRPSARGVGRSSGDTIAGQWEGSFGQLRPQEVRCIVSAAAPVTCACARRRNEGRLDAAAELSPRSDGCGIAPPHAHCVYARSGLSCRARKTYIRMAALRAGRTSGSLRQMGEHMLPPRPSAPVPSFQASMADAVCTVSHSNAQTRIEA